MTSQRRPWPDVAATVLLLAVTGAACFVLAVVWAADFDGDDASSSVAGMSALVLAAGLGVAVVSGVVGRRWRPVWIVLLVAAAVAALPFLTLL